MEQRYHIQITTQALKGTFSQAALQAIIRGNLGQDNLRGQVGHPHYHFDDNCFAGSTAYMEQQRAIIVEALAQDNPQLAWRAFGRLTHAAQDFYAHTSYVRLWRARHPEASPEQIDPADSQIIASPELISGRLYFPLEALAFVPGLERLVKPLLPRDSHTWMNLDTPRQGPLFEFACAAARKQTWAEYEKISGIIGSIEQRGGTAQRQGKPGSQALAQFLDQV